MTEESEQYIKLEPIQCRSVQDNEDDNEYQTDVSGIFNNFDCMNSLVLKPFSQKLNQKYLDDIEKVLGIDYSKKKISEKREVDHSNNNNNKSSSQFRLILDEESHMISIGDEGEEILIDSYDINTDLIQQNKKEPDFEEIASQRSTKSKIMIHQPLPSKDNQTNLFQKLKFIKPDNDRNIVSHASSTQKLKTSYNTSAIKVKQSNNIDHPRCSTTMQLSNSLSLSRDLAAAESNQFLNASITSSQQNTTYSNSKFRQRANKFKEDLDKVFTTSKQSYLSEQRCLSSIRKDSAKSLKFVQMDNDFLNSSQLQLNEKDLQVLLPRNNSRKIEQQQQRTNTLSSTMNYQEEEQKQQYEKKIQDIKKQLEGKYQQECYQFQQQIKTIKEKMKAQVISIIESVKKEEQKNAQQMMQKYERIVKEKWEIREKELKTQEFNRCTEYMQVEKNDLKMQINDLEIKYKKQIEFEQKQYQISQNERESELFKKHQWEIDQLSNEIQELKLQREMQIEMQSDLTRKHQQQIQERVDRVIQEESYRWNDIEMQRNRLRQDVDQLREENTYLNRQNEQLKEFQMMQTKAYQYNQCKTCNVLMIANERLITRIKKYEKILQFKQRPSSATPNPYKEFATKLRMLK